MDKLQKLTLALIVMITVTGGATYSQFNYSSSHIATDVDLPPCH